MTILNNPQEFMAFMQRDVRLLGLDVGTKTIGLALSDIRWIIASSHQTIERHKFSHDVKVLQKIIEFEKVVGLVVGLPINMDGQEGPRCQSTRQFAKNIQQIIPIPLCFWDERLSTMAVTRTMLAADLSRKRRAQVVDKMAACYILQGALDSLNRNI